jgi:hypothetical protein
MHSINTVSKSGPDKISRRLINYNMKIIYIPIKENITKLRPIKDKLRFH